MFVDSAEAVAAFERFDPKQFTHLERYKLLTGTVVPRPIAFVTTLNDDGSVNAAPFSEFMIFSITPALLGFSSGIGKWGTKDTVVNIQRTGEFVINTVSEHLAVPVQECAEELPRNESEITRTGLTTLPSELIAVPRVAESLVQFECKLHRIVEFGNGPNSVVVGEVLRVHAANGLVRDAKVDPLEYKPLGRLGGRRYCTLGRLIDV
jgi:flavin reductase (DIM6/NTAB) family NADH-FMN oxidoreductase RutF